MSRIYVVRKGEADGATAQTSGMVRRAAVTGSRCGAQHLSASVMVSEPRSKSGVHHHGDQETIVYALAGRSALRFGDRGEETVELGPGDFAFIPAGLAHQEMNIGEEPVTWVVTRSGPEPIAVDLPDFPE